MTDPSNLQVVGISVGIATGIVTLVLALGGALFTFGRDRGQQAQKLIDVSDRATVAHSRIDKTNNRVAEVAKASQDTRAEVAALKATVDKIAEAACEPREMVRDMIRK